jgi:peptidoglycan/xylan/chitin deacetylase (PgdA/CDA1 family)
MLCADKMNDHGTATRDRSGPRPAAARTATRRSAEAHHRRRRAFALSVVAAVALIAGISSGAGGGTVAQHKPSAPAGYFGRIRALAGNGAGSFAGQRQADENAAIDRTLAYTPTIQVAGSQNREIALTFDDGPGPYTPQILAILQQQGVPATFFQVGNQLATFHAGTTQVLGMGYPIENHTNTHPSMSRLSAADQRSEMLKQTSAVGSYGVAFPRLFRPPYGLYDGTTLTLLREFHMLNVLWTVDSHDWRRPGEQAIVNTVVSGARPGAIVLMHDAGGPRQQTVAALPQIITQLRAQGYKFVTVPKLLLDNPPPADQQLLRTPAATGAG